MTYQAVILSCQNSDSKWGRINRRDERRIIFNSSGIVMIARVMVVEVDGLKGAGSEISREKESC